MWQACKVRGLFMYGLFAVIMDMYTCIMFVSSVCHMMYGLRISIALA